MDTITITHVATKDTVRTTVQTPWSEPITKTWKRMDAGHYQLDTKIGWDEEDGLPEEVREAADESMTSLCRALDCDA